MNKTTRERLDTVSVLLNDALHPFYDSKQSANKVREAIAILADLPRETDARDACHDTEALRRIGWRSCLYGGVDFKDCVHCQRRIEGVPPGLTLPPDTPPTLEQMKEGNPTWALAVVDNDFEIITYEDCDEAFGFYTNRFESIRESDIQALYHLPPALPVEVRHD